MNCNKKEHPNKIGIEERVLTIHFFRIGPDLQPTHSNVDASNTNTECPKDFNLRPVAARNRIPRGCARPRGQFIDTTFDGWRPRMGLFFTSL